LVIKFHDSLSPTSWRGGFIELARDASIHRQNSVNTGKDRSFRPISVNRDERQRVAESIGAALAVNSGVRGQRQLS
jgi:hypothetical protein